MNVIEKLKAIGGEAMSSAETLKQSYTSACSVILEKVPGVFVECGVYAGCQCGAMALALQEMGDSRKIHCFDSFCGFPKASEKDGADWQDRLGVGSSTEPSNPLDPNWGFALQTLEHVKTNFRHWGFSLDMFAFHKGWFHDTVLGWNEPIALLRIDGDLYDSVLVCLKKLYPHLVPGGICILDDYELEGGRKAFNEYFKGSVDVLVNGSAWWIKR
jgi:O-methyltransferase